jgi:hypothetical protein
MSRSETRSRADNRWPVHADAPGELAYVFDYAAANRDIIAIREP